MSEGVMLGRCLPTDQPDERPETCVWTFDVKDGVWTTECHETILGEPADFETCICGFRIEPRIAGVHEMFPMLFGLTKIE